MFLQRNFAVFSLNCLQALLLLTAHALGPFLPLWTPTYCPAGRLSPPARFPHSIVRNSVSGLYTLGVSFLSVWVAHCASSSSPAAPLPYPQPISLWAEPHRLVSTRLTTWSLLCWCVQHRCLPTHADLLLRFFLEIYTGCGHLKSRCSKWSHWLPSKPAGPSSPVLQLVNSTGARNQGKICPWSCFPPKFNYQSPAFCIFWNIFPFVPPLLQPPIPWMDAYRLSSGGTSVASQLISSDCSSSSSAPQRPTTTTPLLTAATVCCLKPKSACIPLLLTWLLLFTPCPRSGVTFLRKPLVPATTRLD